jgi:hypothetical protein
MKKISLLFVATALIAVTSAFTAPSNSSTTEDPTYKVKNLSGQTIASGLSEEELDGFLADEYSECTGSEEKCATVIDETTNQEVPSLEPMHDN